jgi:muramoyltetrapeptide carboxypeptidase LdcA involved in peptidoglycan recycling
MMYADLIDQEDLLGHLKALGLQIPSGATAEQACECAVRGLDRARANELRRMVKDMYTSRATILPAVRQAIDKQLLPALTQYQQNHSG